MARQANRLNARSVAALSKPGRHSDGGGLYLVVDKNGSKRWAFLFRWRGKLKEMGLGSIGAVSLARARELAIDARRSVAEGTNPIEARKRQGAIVTFGDAADQLIASLSPSWRNAKHKAQWEMTLAVYCKAIRGLPVHTITTEDVLSVLNPIWSTKAETATRVRGRIERVLDAAKARGQRSGENPAAWRGHLKNLLPKRHALTRGHHAAMPFDRVGRFFEDLHQRESMGALALEFVILTAARTGEVIGAAWAEYDPDEKVWTVPAARMKGGRDHRVPLSTRAAAILDGLASVRSDNNPASYIFHGQRRGKTLSNTTMDALLRRMGETEITVHGFRSTFRDWAGERSTFSREVAEAALAHLVGDQTERAYRRGDALEKRRKLMEAWAEFCLSPKGDNVVSFGSGRG